MNDWIQTIGTDPRNDVAIKARAGRSPFHAKIRKLHGRLFINDLESEGGTWINQIRIPSGMWVEVSFFDTVELGGHAQDGTKPARLAFTPSMYWGVKGALGLAFQTERLSIRAGGKTLCDGAFLNVARGRLCAIMGPSGCGKSIFLEALAGLRAPHSGRIFLADKRQCIEPYREGRANYIAFVPQADVLIRDLTVSASLESRVNLVYPGIGDKVRSRIVKSIAASLGFHGERLGRFLATRIGSPEDRAAVLSGGERRRASVGHEMVANPMAILLDEPTSGLSSVDAFEVVQHLRKTGQSYRIPIIVSIHQPASELLALFDDLLVMAYGGRLLYHGPADGAASLLREWASEGVAEGDLPPAELEKIDSLDHNSADFFLKVQEHPKVRDYLIGRFEVAANSGHGSVYGPVGDARALESVSLASAESTWLGNWAWAVMRFFRNTWELVARSQRTLRADTVNLWLIVVQAPLLAALVCLAFSMGRDKLYKDDHFARSVYWVKQLSERNRVSDQDMTPKMMLIKGTDMADADRAHLGEGHARVEATVLFVLAFAVLWLTTVNAAKEIVQDYPVIAQEARAGIGVVPVLLSRFLVLTFISAGQSLLLLIVFGTMLVNDRNLHWYFAAWQSLVLCGGLSAASGLLVSAVSSTYRLALTIVPLITIPQVLFAGVLQTVPIATGHISRHLLSLLPLRMAWQNLLQGNPLWSEGVIIIEGNRVDRSRIGGIMDVAENLVTPQVRGFRDLYFAGADWGSLCSWVMAIECAAVLFVAMVVLRQRIRRGIR